MLVFVSLLVCLLVCSGNHNVAIYPYDVFTTGLSRQHAVLRMLQGIMIRMIVWFEQYHNIAAMQ
jgi:hypothetical protein